MQINPDQLILRPESFRLRGTLRPVQGLVELAVADFCETIALAQETGASGLELRATVSGCA